MDAQASGEVVRAAGGIVCRDTRGGVNIAVVRRERHKGDWTLPKGHLDDGETWEEAAIREVREETGCEVEVFGVAEPISYVVNGVPKIVLFFTMRLVAEGPTQSGDEVREVAWMTPVDAIRRLTYSREADLVAQTFAGLDDAVNRKRFRGSIRTERLRSTLNVEQQLIQSRVDRVPTALDVDLGIDWRSNVLYLLKQARASLADDRIEEGWRSLNAARRLSVFGMLPKERALEGVRLLEEARVKLDSWRLRAVEHALGPPQGHNRPPPEPINLYFARELMDDHFDTVYLRFGLLERRLLQLPVLLAVVLAGILALVIFEVPTAGPETTLGSWRRLTTVMVLGILGAIVSSTLAGLRNPLRGRITEIMQRDAIMLLRPLVGAASAVTVAVVFESGIVSAIDVTGVGVFPFAVAAGFTERLITRVMKSVEDNAAQGEASVQ